MGVTGEPQHGHVPVGVAHRHDGLSADAAPDADRLGRPVVEELHLPLVEDLRPALDLAVLDRQGAADHPLGRDAVELAGDGAHEVPVAAGGDVGGEAVGLQVAQQLDHGPIAAGRVRAVQGGVARLVEEARDEGRVGGHGHVREGRGHRAHQQPEIVVVTVVVLHHGVTQPVHVLLVGRLPRLAVPERGGVLGHLGQPAEGEVELDRHGQPHPVHQQRQQRQQLDCPWLPYRPAADVVMTTRP